MNQPQTLGYWLRELFGAWPLLLICWLALTREKRKAQGREIAERQKREQEQKNNVVG